MICNGVVGVACMRTRAAAAAAPPPPPQLAEGLSNAQLAEGLSNPRSKWCWLAWDTNRPLVVKLVVKEHTAHGGVVEPSLKVVLSC